jgi:predicted ABC-type transport system involved in lysophospholipase L1 biosynthesis ATPase subunit
MTAVTTNSVAIVGESGSAKSALRSLTKVECQSPVSTTGLAMFRLMTWPRTRLRAAG